MPSDAPRVLDDPARLAVLRAAGLATPEPEAAFERLAGVTARAVGAPVAYLSFLDGGRQYFKGLVGIGPPLADTRELGVEHSVCTHVVATARHLCVEDVAADPRTAGHPALPALGIRAYAGVPVMAGDGHAVGTLCVCDHQPRRWTAAELELMVDLAAVAAGEVEWRRRAADTSADAETLRAAESLFRPLVEQSLAGIYVIQDGVFRYVNPRLAEIFGYPAAHFYSPRAVMSLVAEADRPRVAENIRRRLAGEVDTLRYRFRGRRSDGSLLHLEVHGTRTELDGRPALIGVAIDVSDQVHAEQARERALAARDRFYAMMSHELRTPVSAIMLYNDLLLTGVYEALNAQQTVAVNRAQRSARHLLELINDLLDLSKLHAGKLDTRVEDVDLAALVEEAAGELAPLALEVRCELELRVETRPLPLASDARRLRQIVVNLLSNALKFGRGRPVRVRCGREGDRLVVEVLDQGRGIAAADLERIFEDFVQVGESDAAGTGLGLPLARRLAVLLGGNLCVRSRPGEGSSFRLEVPPVPPRDDAPFRAE